MTHRVKQDRTARILIADDDGASRLVAREALEQAGFSVLETSNGQEAVTVFEASRPQLVVLDVLMPVMNGFQACRAIRSLPGGAAAPILMLTGLDDTESINQAYEAGATDFATKPIPWAILVHRVRYMLRARSAVDDLRESEARLAEAQKIARMGHWERNLKTGEILISREARRIIHMPPGSPAPSLDDLLDRIHIADRAFLSHALAEMSQGRDSVSLDLRVQVPDAGLRHVQLRARLIRADGDRPARIAGTFQDITERREAEDRVRFLAHFDEVTQLPNRILLMDRLRMALMAARRNRRKVATLFLDLDRFKRINDTLGHSVGDQLLASVARRLQHSVRETDTVSRQTAESDTATLVARFGGDEFVLVLPEFVRDVDAARVAKRILDSLLEPVHLEGHEVLVSGSIGISLFPDDGDDVETLLRNADTAMYHAKESGRGRYQFYTESMNAVAFQRLSMENSLRKALDRSEFELHYQPQVDVATGRIVGAEALIRWKHPDLGLIPPNEFIPVAEETGLIIPIGDWVLRSASRQAQAWEGAGRGPLRIAVNVSGHQFWQKNFILTVADALAEVGLPARALEIEITESVLMRQCEETVATLDELKTMGIKIAIDDFGTGYSSLAYLRRFPVDTLKVDRCFIRGIAENPDDEAMAGAIVAMAKSLKLEVVAEGVETIEQLEVLRRLGYPLAQGYLLGKPVPATVFESLLNDPCCVPTIPRC